MSEQNETFRKVAEVLFKKPVEFAEDQDPMTVLMDLQKEHSETLIKKADDKYNHGYKNGAVELEKKIRSSFGVEDKLEGEDLLKHLTELMESVRGADPEELKKIKADYQSKLEAIQKQKEESSNEWKEKYEGVMSQIAQKDAVAKFNDAVSPFLNDPTLDIPEDAEARSMKIAAFKSALAGHKLKYTETGVQVLGEDGTSLLDGHGRVVTFAELAKKYASGLIGYKKGRKAGTPFTSSDNETKEDLQKWLTENEKRKGSEEYKQKRSKYVALCKST